MQLKRLFLTNHPILGLPCIQNDGRHPNPFEKELANALTVTLIEYYDIEDRSLVTHVKGIH